MCVEVAVKRGDKYKFCSTVGELAKALHIKQRLVSPDPFEACLCNARLDLLGARKATEDFPFSDYIIEVSDERG